MRPEQSIPLFLWVAAAVIAHAIFGGGAHEVGSVLSERIDVANFALQVSKKAKSGSRPTEITLFDPEAPPEEEPEESEPEEEAPPEDKETKSEATAEEATPPKKKPEEKKEEERKKPEAKPEEKKPDLLVAPTPPPPPPAADRRIAIKQHVEPNQEDNPNARQIADEANKVAEETVARNTSTSDDSPDPTPPRPHSGEEKTPGDSERNRVAQNEEQRGEAAAASPTPPEKTARPTTDSSNPGAQAKAATPMPAPNSAAPKARPETPGSEAREARNAQTETPDVLRTPGGSEGMKVGDPKAAQSAQKAQKRLPPSKRSRENEILGFGSQGTTKRGVNLNLSAADANEIVGQDRLLAARKTMQEKRLAEHRGSFSNMGLEKWRSAIENYVTTAKPGNQTALNAARVPFASYLNEIHNRIHPVFAEGFLATLTSLPADHPLNRKDMSTHVEIALDPADGRIVKMGITQSSGVTMFDVGALESVQKASPFGPAPSAILSSDGKVYLHWEFHREPEMACSTYFARPLILNLGPASAPPKAPPPKPPEGQTNDARTGDRSSPPETSDERPKQSG